MTRVVAAMSGGVDSSVAAALVKEAGYEVVGATLKLLPGSPTGFGCCGSPDDIADAKRVCETLGIRHYVLNFDELFERDVIGLFVKDYLDSRTPNPCVECNRSVKFGTLLRLAGALDAQFVATGHYARIEHTDNGVHHMRRSVDEGKDQTYFLHALSQDQLARILFPVGHLTKDQVREKARALGLKTADKPESQEICFVPNRDYRGFLRAHAPEDSPALQPGDIRNAKGELLGRHTGLSDYTIGQRKGLGLTSVEPLYVTGLDKASNTLIVGGDAETLRSRFRVERLTWTGAAPRGKVGVRIRHRGNVADAELQGGPQGAVDVALAQGERAVTPGQTAVFYEGERVLGGGTIREVL
jgi:tRNA-specific 2-thiouridylase